MWKLTTFFPSKDRRALATDLNRSAIDGTTLNFPPLSLAVTPLVYDACNQTKNAPVFVKP